MPCLKLETILDRSQQTAQHLSRVLMYTPCVLGVCAVERLFCVLRVRLESGVSVGGGSETRDVFRYQ